MRQIEEIIVVEGEHDRARVLGAVRADVVVTGGARISRATFALLERAQKTRGIIILTDPDHAGEQIRRVLAKRFPDCRHAFLARTAAQGDGDVGVEHAAPADIASALARVRTMAERPREEFTYVDLLRHRLTGERGAALRRAELGARLGIGYANAGEFLRRLNAFRVTREEFASGLHAAGVGE